MIVQLQEFLPTQELPFDDVHPFVPEDVRREQLDSLMESNAMKTLFMLKSKQYSLGQFFKEYQELPAVDQEQFAGPDGSSLLTS